MTYGPARYLVWLAVRQWPRILLAVFLGTTWMLTVVLTPYLIGQAVDRGLRGGDHRALWLWSSLTGGMAVVSALLGLLRHRTMSKIRMDAGYRTIRQVLDHAVRLGAALPRRITAGEVVTIGVGDVWVTARALTFTGPGIGSFIGYLVVAVLLFRTSAVIALVVLAGVPVVAVVVAPLLAAMRKAGGRYRAETGLLTGRLLDIVGGLRLLNGLGGKPAHAARYRQGSASVLAEGYRVASVSSWIESLAVGLPTLFLAVVTWLAAHLAASGDITIGELTAVYGYAAILALPVGMLIEGGKQISEGIVASRRIVALLNIPPDPDDGSSPPPDGPSVLHDPDSGIYVRPGLLTALVGPGAAAVVDRLGGYGPTGAVWGAGRLDQVPRAAVRSRILVADDDAHLFPGPLSEVVAGRSPVSEPEVAEALFTAGATDIAGDVAPDGRNLSGGQRQRVRLARALYQRPEVLLAVEPTSAVDAHTESAIATRLAESRAGLATVIVTTSPVMLDRADVVYFLVDGQVDAYGTHRELVGASPAYRDLVSRS